MFRPVLKSNTGCKLVAHRVAVFPNFGTNLFRKFHIQIWISRFSWKPGRAGSPGAEPHIPAWPPVVAEGQLSPSDSSPRPPALCCLPETEAVFMALIFKPVFLFSYSKDNRKAPLVSMALSKGGKWQTTGTRLKADMILCELCSCAHKTESVLWEDTVQGSACCRSGSHITHWHYLPGAFKHLNS